MSTKRHTTLHVSIVTYDTPIDMLKIALDSIIVAVNRLQLVKPSISVKITLVNNSEGNSLDLEEFQSLQAKDEVGQLELYLIQGHINVGYGRGQNMAFFSRQSTYHLFMNPDVELEPDCLSEGISYLERHTDVAIASPQAHNYEGEKQFLCKEFPTVWIFFVRGFIPKRFKGIFKKQIKRYEMQNLSEAIPTKEIPIVSGCFMLCRSDIIRKVSGFDPHYFLYFEDFNLSLRVGDISCLAYVPAMRIRHRGGGAAKKGIHHVKLFIRSGCRFFSDHGWKWI